MDSGYFAKIEFKDTWNPVIKFLGMVSIFQNKQTRNKGKNEENETKEKKKAYLSATSAKAATKSKLLTNQVIAFVLTFFMTRFPSYRETSQLICNTNQQTRFNARGKLPWNRLITAKRAPETLERHIHVSEVTRCQMYYLCLENQSGHGVFKLDKPGFT